MPSKNSNLLPLSNLRLAQIAAQASALAIGCYVYLISSFALAQPAQRPLWLTSTAPPAVLLTMGRDHKLYYEAYNDASDIDGDGQVDSGFKPESITYFGLFDSYKCYSYSASNQYFSPTAFSATKKCSGAWSGDFLNYVTTTRIDAVRRVLYGGKRVVDTATETILERAYIPQDSHSFGKEWASVANNGYLLSDYTPLASPASGKRYLFASVTLLTGNSRTDTNPPLLRVLQSDKRIWNWLAKERPVADNSLGTPTDFVVRVKACVSGLLEQECQGYPNGAPIVYKPTGILHEFGDEGQMHFGLLSGSYDRNNAGGVLRKNISNFATEINSATGQFLTTTKGIVGNLDALRVQGFGNSHHYDCGWNVGDPTTSGQACDDWGNPIAEMMYEGLRYFSGKTTPTSDYFASNPTKDNAIGLTRPSWVDPYKSTGNPAGLPYCSKPVQMVIADTYASFDSDQVPGSAFSSFSGDLSGLNVSTISDLISGAEGISGNYFIGQSGSLFDKIPSAKSISGFGNIRGLAPDEPTRAGSYYSAAVAHYGKGTDLRTDLADGGWAQTVDTYSIALASPLPKIQIPVGEAADKRFVTIVPFGKSVGGFGISAASTDYQPTNQVVDFYIQEIVNQPGFPTKSTVNDGRPFGRFRINFEDVEQGADHDMDAIAIFEYALEADGRIRITLDSEYAAGGIIQHMGYVLSGTTADGTYLVIRDRDTDPASDVNYYLDKKASTYTVAGLPLTDTRRFTPGSAADGKFIPKDPLWYAAKYGGYPDKRDPSTRQVIATGINGAIESGGDTRKAGEPDNYFLVTNAAKLRDQLRNAFADIQSKTGSSTAQTSGTTALTTRSRAYTAEYNSNGWTGEVTGYKVARNGKETQLWKTSDTNSFPALHTARSVLSIWNGTAVNFLPSGTSNLPTASTSAFNLSSIYPLFDADPSLNWTTLSATAKSAKAKELLVNYIRGDRSREKAKGGTLRDRNKLLGDIVNSNIVYATDQDYGFYQLPGAQGSSYPAWIESKSTSSLYKTIYIGANDGMLHAFDAETGIERFAFVPSGVFGKLHKYITPGAPHEYYVDGRLTLSDAYRSSGWTTVMLGSTGAGGKSVFALDVGNPSGTLSNVLWEFKDADLGFPIGTPLIGRTQGENGKWVAVFANGYHGVGRKAVVFVLDLFTGTLLKRLPLEISSGVNGIGSVAGLQRGGMIDQLFGGDILGNLWKIDASSSDPSNWKIANGELPILKATTPTGGVQPITAVVSVAPLNSGLQVFLGTGKLFEDADRNNTDVQSVYGLWLQKDPGKTLTRSDLLQQQIVSESTSFRTVSNNTGTGNEWGWQLDLVSPGTLIPTGERIIAPVHFSLGYLDFNTWFLGTQDACKPGGESWGMALEGATGSVSAPKFNVDGSPLINNLDKIGGRFAAGIKLIATVADPAITITPGGGSDDKGSYDTTGTLKITEREAGTCPPCHSIRKDVAASSSTSATQCRPIAICLPDSWIQLQ